MRICLHKRSEIQAFLMRSPGLHLYELGDLDAFFWPHTLWFGWQVKGQLAALALLYTGDRVPVLLAMQRSDAQLELLKSLEPLLPTRFYAHLAPGLEVAFAGLRSARGGERYLRMLRDLHSSANPSPADRRARPLQSDDLPALESFYQQHYPDNWFNPRMLATGCYQGIWQDQQLLAVAGVHVYAPQLGVAALGNIAVAEQARGQGLGYAVTQALCQQLESQFQQAGLDLQSCTMGLNVFSENPAAIRCYQRLGFEVLADYHEWSFSPLHPFV